MAAISSSNSTPVSFPPSSGSSRQPGVSISNNNIIRRSVSSVSDEVCVVPIGWKRELVQGRIVFTSPSQSTLWSHADVFSYLTTDGTCKCGLPCPLHVHKVFNFDARCNLQRYAGLADSEDSNQNNQNHCHQHRKLHAMAHYRSMLAAGTTRHGSSTGGDCDQQQVHQQPGQRQQQLHPQNLSLQPQDQQHVKGRAVADLSDNFSNLVHERQPEIRSPRVNHLSPNEEKQQFQMQNQQQLSPLVVGVVHGASQQLVVDPREVNGREMPSAARYVNGADTHVHQQEVHHHNHNQNQLLQQQHHLNAHQHQMPQHLSHSPPDSRQLHDVTADTASITELIPSVGHLMPQVHHLQHQGQQGQGSGHVQYSLILPPHQQILTMQSPADHQQHTTQMLLSPHLVAPFAHHGHAIAPAFHHAHQQAYSQQIFYESPTNTADLLKQQQGSSSSYSRRKRSGKKVRTVAAILNLST